MVSGIDAEDVAVLCLLVADGDLAITAADLADLLDATERRAGASFGPVPGALRRALGGLVLEAALASPEEIRDMGVDGVLARVTLWDLLAPMLSRDRVWFAADGGVHWTPAAPGSPAGQGSRGRAAALLALAASGAAPPAVIAVLERLGVTRAFIRTLLDPDRPTEDDDLRRQVAYQDWFE
ncbi:MAG: hypothetical protein ABFC89_13770 [Methanospirillum sp.]